MPTEEFAKKTGGKPRYIDREEARAVLAAMGVELNERQMKRATEKDARGRRKLPFFLDPIDGKLKIEKNTLVKIYLDRQVEAENNCSIISNYNL